MRQTNYVKGLQGFWWSWMVFVTLKSSISRARRYQISTLFKIYDIRVLENHGFGQR